MSSGFAVVGREVAGNCAGVAPSDARQIKFNTDDPAPKRNAAVGLTKAGPLLGLNK